MDKKDMATSPCVLCVRVLACLYPACVFVKRCSS